MNTAATLSSSGTGPSPDALRNYLSERSRTELDELRSELDARLLALENALTSPDDCESLESLVIDLARVAMDEAEAAARRAIFDAQSDAQEQIEAARADARTSIEAARTDGGGAASRSRYHPREHDNAPARSRRSAQRAQAERETSAALQKDLQKTRASLDSDARGD